MASSWKDKAKDRVREKSQGKTYKLTEGENTFRILPDPRGPEYAPYTEYLVHRDVGPDKKMARCGKEFDTKEGECWLCDEIIPALEKSKKRAKINIAKALAPKEQFVVQVIYLDQASDKWRGPLLWFVSTGGARSLSTAVLALLSSTKKDYSDAKKGRNINLSRTGTDWKNTRYGTIEPDDDPSAVPKTIMASLKPIDNLIDAYDEEVQKAAYYGRDVDTEDLDEDEDDKSKKKVKGKAKPEPEEDEEEDESEEEIEEEDEEEEEPPKKKKPGPKPKKKVAKDEEEDEESEDEEEEPEEDEDEDEEDEEEPLSKKKPVKKKKKPEPEDEESEDEEEEEPEEDEEEDEEEEEPPKKKKPGPKPKKKVAKDEDEEEDEEEEEPEEESEEDDEEEEPPKKKVVKKKVRK